jgi:hypothetical protein
MEKNAEVEIEDVLKNMREWAGALVQENAILKAQLNKSTTNP